MSLGAYGILIIFGLFILLLIVNPNLSCFGKRVKSPFYPLLRRKQRKKKAAGQDHGHDANTDAGTKERKSTETAARKKTEDYGFHLD